MATAAPSTDQAAGLLQDLSLDSQPKNLEVPQVDKRASAIKYESINGGDAKTLQIPSFERPITPVPQDFVDPNMCYVPNGYGPYYYGGYDSGWDEYHRYMNTDGVEMTSGAYTDHASLFYHHGYSFPPYRTYPPAGSPVPTIAADGQLYGPQHYQYPAPYYQPPTPPTVPNQGPAGQGELSTSAATEQASLPVGPGNANTNAIANVTSSGPVPFGLSFSNSSSNSNVSYGRGVLPGRIHPAGYQDPRLGFDGQRSPVPWGDAAFFADAKLRPTTSTSMSSTASHISNTSLARNSNLHPVPSPMGLQSHRPSPGMGPTPFTDQMYTNNKIYGNYSTTIRMSPGFGSSGYDSRPNGRGWIVVDKHKSRVRGNGSFGYGTENVDGLNELNRGPRAGRFRNQNSFGPHITIATKGQELPSNGSSADSSLVPDRDQFNREDFPIGYGNAKFFVIKSYSEDDIHKSIKYNMWASTPSGNKKLDAAYEEAQEKSDGCPLFLFFSVNTSGQFVGLAEMVGPVDFNRNLEYWQQDKWNGCFPVKWHIVKDVPNSLLKHITLENNDNKPVTNSRDCQEIKLDQGLEMLKIFKEYTNKVCILDDFHFYDARQKTIQEKKAKQQSQRQAWHGKQQTDGDKDEPKEGQNSKANLEKPPDSSHGLVDKKLPEIAAVFGCGATDFVK